MKVKNIEEAWYEADKIIPNDYMKDEHASERAGYPIYRSTVEYYDYICDLGSRLEVSLANGETVNIWIEPEPEFKEYQIEDALSVVSDTIYEIDDKINGKLAEVSGIAEARNILYKSYSAMYEILKESYPESRLIKNYNLGI